MGIKGRRKRQREQAKKTLAQMEADGLIDAEMLDRLDEEEDEEFVGEAPPAAFMSGPYKLPKGASAVNTKLSNSEKWKMQDEDYLEVAREEHKNRKNSHLKTQNTKKARKEDAERERETKEVMAKEQLAENYNLNTIDALIGNKSEGNTNRNKAASGPQTTNALLGIHETLVKALRAEGFARLTKIQERSIPLVMQGYDILGQAKTGSGKTLAFVIPMLNSIIPILQNAQKNTNASSTKKFPFLGLVLAPTKELAVQIHKVIEGLIQHFNSADSPVKVDVRAHLITGGTNINEERKVLLAGTNIVVGTPGRILDHVRHCQGWNLATLKFLVLDEADRMLADGFQRDLDSILAGLPKASRQTFLFSATNSKSVRNLARLSLSHTPVIVNTKGDAPEFVDPECPLPPLSYIDFGDDDDEDDGDEGTNDNANEEGANKKSAKSKDLEDIPSQLRQFCYIGKLEDRLRALYVFVKRVARKSKAMIFCSTVASTIFHCQMMGSVGFHNEVLMLHSHMKTRQRLQTMEAFNSWDTGVLFCTDVASRGLDIPKVDWILQFDPPLDPTEYIHRVGRTARAGSAGNAIIFLSEEEAPFVTYLSRFKIVLERLPMPDKLPDIQAQLERVLQLDEIVAKSAINAYRAHVGAYQSHLLQQVFNIQRLDLDALATAFALTSAPAVSLPKNSADEKKKDYVAGKLKSLNRRKKEALKHFHQMKTKSQWTDDGRFVGVTKPVMSEP